MDGVKISFVKYREKKWFAFALVLRFIVYYIYESVQFVKNKYV